VRVMASPENVRACGCAAVYQTSRSVAITCTDLGPQPASELSKRKGFGAKWYAWPV
jgi:hypothetical protein